MKVEILSANQPTATASRLLTAMEFALRESDMGIPTSRLKGDADALLLFGVGYPEHDKARRHYVKHGKPSFLWDLGYFGDRRGEGYLRFSIDHEHPQGLLDRAPSDAKRWEVHGIDLTEEGDPEGSIILVGLGMKSRRYLRMPSWEKQTFDRLRREFPGRRIIYRPKGKDRQPIKTEMDADTPIAELLKGAGLVVCRHSNVAVDATIAGVPFRCEDGAAVWLQKRPYTRDNRREFLHRLAYFQWRADEAPEAWEFAKRIALCV